MLSSLKKKEADYILPVHLEGFSRLLPHKWPFWFALLVIVLLTFVVYWPAISGGFIWDDARYVSDNPLLTASDGLWRIWMTTESIQYYPAVFTTFWLEYRLWGLQPMGYHIVNVALHAINAILFWLLLSRLKIKGAWLAGAIFALHPVHVESVAWITERKNVLSGMFYLLTTLSYLRFVDCREWRWYAVTFGLFLLALFSKTVTCSLPIVLPFLLWFRGWRVNWRDIRLLIPFVVAGLVMGLLTVWLEVHQVGAQGEEWDLSIWQRLLLAGRALWFYAIKLFWPTDLAFIYPRWRLVVMDFWQWFWPLGVAAVGLGFWRFREKVGRGSLVGVAFFSITLFPALGFFDVFPMRYSFVADHFQYLASLGLIALSVGSVVWGFERWGLSQARWSSKVYGLGVGLGVIVLLVIGMLTWRQAHIYQDLETLWKDTIKKNPTGWMPHNNLGVIYLDTGRIEEALEEYQIALKLNPTEIVVHNNLGSFYLSQGRIESAIKEYKTVVEIDPDNAHAHSTLGFIYQKKGMINDAMIEYRTVLRVDPESIDAADAHYALGLIYTERGLLDQAILEFQEALKIDPNFEEAYGKLRDIMNQ